MQFVHQERERERERESMANLLTKTEVKHKILFLRQKVFYVPLMYHLQLWTQKHDSQFEDRKIEENVGLGEENCMLFVWLLDINTVVVDLSKS